MREILFRGKRIDNGEWIEGTLYQISTDLPPFIMLMNSHAESHEVVPETVGQYTGLTDRLGKRIFEGDIVKTPFCGKTLCDFSIQFINGGFYAVPPGVTVDESRPWKHHLNGSNSRMVVIGNIHDNPELLEVPHE